MSCCGAFIMPQDLLPPLAERRPAPGFTLNGRHVFAIVTAFFVVVASVNGYMMYSAFSTMPGLDAGRNGYEVSQRWNGQIDAAAAQDARGWQARGDVARVAEGTRAAAEFRTAAGRPIDGLEVEFSFNHPASRRLDHVVKLVAAGDGRYQAAFETLASPIWDVAIVARRDGEIVYQSRSRKRI
jgi:nitrogen fixation protein FixH